MMRKFIQLKNNIVVGETNSQNVPGHGPEIPSDMMEVTGRNDGPFDFKQYDPIADLFSVVPPPPPTADEIEADRLIAIAPQDFTREDEISLRLLELKRRR